MDDRLQPQQIHQQIQHQPIHEELFQFFLHRSWKKKLFTVLAILTLVPVILDMFVLRTGGVSGFIDAFLDWMAHHPLMGVWAYIFALVLTSLVFVPPSVMVFAAGFVFQSLWGPVSGMTIALTACFLGCVLGGLVGFWRAKYMTRDLVEVLLRRYPVMRAVDAAVVRNSFRVMALMRLNCLIPFGVLNYVFGITGVEWAAFLLAMVGILPWHALLVFLGASAEDIYEGGAAATLPGAILIGTGMAFGGIGLAITWRFAKIELQREVDMAARSSGGPPPPTVDDYRTSPGGDRRHTAWKSSFRRTEQRQVPNVDGSGGTAKTGSGNIHIRSVEDADPYHATDYFLMHALGMDVSPVEVEYGAQDANYQERLGWNEIMLDDFS